MFQCWSRADWDLALLRDLPLQPSASRTGRGWAGPVRSRGAGALSEWGSVFASPELDPERNLGSGKEGSLHSGPSMAVEVDGKGTCMWLFTGQAALQGPGRWRAL